MSEYTPTPNEIRADFITLHTRNFDSYTVGRSLTSEQEVYGDAFDRMIAEVRREAAEKAWREGELAGTRNQRDFHLYQQGKITETEYERRVNERANPYRAEAYRQEREEQ